ncbi:hypothetical protein [Niastella sp. OAS944]|uniref:hypothetical protein n=1 Tax=Niastella sp. OAS944 TaxID=2664089 RepID=UPI0034719D3B|nr:hypothetical protein [Chitinophagaceae bacterium OAS944]
MNDSNEKEWSPNYPVPEAERQAYRDRITVEMQKMAEKIQEVSAQPFDEKDIWATVGNIRYGHPTAPLLLRYKALMWFHMNPPDPRGEPMCSRAAPYTVYLRRKDMSQLLGESMRTLDRMLAIIREVAFIKTYQKITVERFCYLNGLPEDKIQEQLHELFLKRWDKPKFKSK